MKLSNRNNLLLSSALLLSYLLGVIIYAMCSDSAAPSSAIDYAHKLAAPSPTHIFGTDHLGRDMLSLCVQGLAHSFLIGLIATIVSTLIAVMLGLLAASYGGAIDRTVNFLVDLFLGIPHIVLLLLISFMLGKGVLGVTAAVALTHWPTLTRIVREEVLAVRSSQYVLVAKALGKTRLHIARVHLLPHIIPAALVGAVVLFPHTIMHEAALTFLGFGLPREIPAIGNILSGAMNYLALGDWWLALFPGVLLLVLVLLLFRIGDTLQKLYTPRSAQE